ncbi:hypothetical protein MES5069_360034 [Mesorhizobium escarrei]|uniref:Secreted protein n=1 Tax=Mesorhizobium escarrei TaxID=666018 RepID=A0ABM9E2S4_9HYPH|nr:hypothetical protein MES5069_360034 [Mesorhizobium escarrei]
MKGFMRRALSSCFMHVTAARPRVRPWIRRKGMLLLRPWVRPKGMLLRDMHQESEPSGAPAELPPKERTPVAKRSGRNRRSQPHQRQPMVPLAGIEPATSGSTIRRSNHLSYNGTFA